MSRGNVVFLLDSAPTTWTSQEDRHLRLCQALIRQGIQPVLVFARPLPPNMHARFRADGAHVEAIDYGKGARRYYHEVRQLVLKHAITTAHIVFFDYFSAVPWIARLCGIRHVVYEMQNSGEFRARSWKKCLLQARTKAMTTPVARVIAISEFVKEQLVNGGLAEAKVVVRYLGVDIDRFRPDPHARQEWASRFSLQPGEVILSTVSYLRPFKNPQVLVEACERLARRNVKARLFVAGDGEMLAGLKSFAERLGVADRIEWLGNVAEPKILLQASDLFLLASVGEAFGLVLAEAMACGIPVVGSRSGSLMEVVDDQRTGLLCTPLDGTAFADSIERLTRDVQLRREMGVRAVERVRRHFTLDIDVDKTLGIYESIWSGDPTGRGD